MAPPPDTLHARGFAADARTERALREGLAGCEAKIRRGRLPAAIQALAAEPAVKLVFVDLDGVPEPEAAVRELTSVCALGTVMIAIGSIDTAHLTRALLRDGMADYLVKPISAADVREARLMALDDLPERTYAGRVIAFAGSSGSGVSTLVAALAREVGTHGRRTVAVVDLDPVSGMLSTALGAEPAGDLPALLATLDPGPQLSDSDQSSGLDLPLDSSLDPPLDPSLDPSLDPGEPDDFDPPISPEQLDRVCAPAGAGISLVAYPLEGPLPATPPSPAMRTLLKHLANRAHVVLVAGATDPDSRIEIMQQADTRVLLYEPTLPSISVAVRCLALFGTEHPAILVQCHPRKRASPLSPAQIRYAFAERRPDVVIPFEPTLYAASTGKTARAPGKAYREALRRVIEQAIEGPAPSSL